MTMDIKLAGRAIQYHGIDLVHKITDEQQEQPSAAILSYVDRRQARDPEIKDEEFQRSICSFIGRKSDLLFKPLSEEEKDRSKVEESIDDSYAIMPPLETFMDAPSHLRREHFYKSLKADDCVTGVVNSILDNGLRVHLLCVDKGRSRDIEDLDIMAFCPAKELPKLYAHESALDAFQEKDIVRGIVLSVSAEAERIIISLHGRSIPDEKTYPRIGLITEDEFPVHFRRKSQIQGMCYEEMLHSILGFNNQGNVKALVSQLQIPETASHLRCHARLKIPEKEYAEGLNKWQSQKLAHKSVAQGVDMFKEGKYLEALQHFNRALQIDKQNVEALVARGAFDLVGFDFQHDKTRWELDVTGRCFGLNRYANKENFNHAIQDFEEALSINPKHSNARNYLIETLLTYGKTCEDMRQLEEACDHYSHVLKLDPDHTEAQEMLAGCRRLMAFQTVPDTSAGKKEAKQKEKRKDSMGSESEADGGKDKPKSSVLSNTAAKLRQLIQEDEKGKSRGKKKKELSPRSSSRLSKDSRKRKRHRSSSSSSSGSSSSTNSSSTGSSSSSSSSSSEGKRKGKRGPRKSRRDSAASDRSRDLLKKFDKKRLSPGEASPREDRKKKKTEDRKERRQSQGSFERKEEAKYLPACRSKEKSPQLDKREEDMFAHSIQSNAAASFMPVSSFDFFNRSAAIPGLGSPPPADVGIARDKTASDASVTEQQRQTGRNADRERSAGEAKTLRRDDFLMAEREKFYRDNKDRYKKVRPSLRSRSRSASSSSRSSSFSRSGNKRSRSGVRQSSRSRSGSPIVTGVKELDMYLGGAKKLISRAQLGEKYTSWESFTRHSHDRRSGSKDRRSKTPESRSLNRRSKSPGFRPGNRRSGSRGYRSKSPGSRFGKRRSASGGRGSRSPGSRLSKGRSGSRDHGSKSPGSRLSTRRSGSRGRRSRSTGPRRKLRRSRSRDDRSRSPGTKSLNRRSDSHSDEKARDKPHGERGVKRSPLYHHREARKVMEVQKSRWDDDGFNDGDGTMSAAVKNTLKVKQQLDANSSHDTEGRDRDSKMWGQSEPLPSRLSDEREARRKRENVDMVRGITVEKGRDSFLRRQVGDNEVRNEDRDKMRNIAFGKFGPVVMKGKSVSEREESPRRKAEIKPDDTYAIYKEDELVNVSKISEKDASLKRSSLESKPKGDAFMPRILRKPKMDDPDLNRPMLSSNQLAALEREKKKKRAKSEKEQEKNEEEQGKGKVSDSYSGKRLKTEEMKDLRGSQERGRRRSRSRKSRSRSQDRKRRRSRNGDNRERRSKSMELDRKNNRGERSRSRGRDEKRFQSERGRIKGNEDDRNTGKEEASDPRDGTKGDAAKESTKWIQEDEIEKEIERRVQQRLKEEEEKLKMAAGMNTVVVKKSRWDEENKNIKADTQISVSYQVGDKSSSIHKNFHDMQEGSKKGSLQVHSQGNSAVLRDPVVELNKGWTLDMLGNRYFATRGKVFNFGWHKDRFGNAFYIGAEKGSDSQRLERSEMTGKDGGRGHKAGGRNAERSIGDSEAGRTDSQSGRQRETEPTDNLPGKDRGRDSDRGEEKAEFESKQSKCRSSPSRSRSRSSSSSGRRHSRSRSRRRGRRSRSKNKRSRSRSRHRFRSQSRERKSRSRSRHRRSRSDSRDGSRSRSRRGELKDSRGSSSTASKKENSSVGGSAETGHQDSARPGKRSSPNLPQSKWDAVDTSRWGSSQKSIEVKVQEDQDDSDEEKGERKKESLSELEKFLIDLKQQKKKQWIAEGKLKEKD